MTGPQQSTSASKPGERSRKRLTKVIILSIIVLLLMLSLIVQGGFNLRSVLSPDNTSETLTLYALSTLNFLAFITLLFILLRNVLKLARELRAGRLGSKFKARMVTYAIGLSLLPVLLLFFFAFGLLNRSIDRWFGEPARQIVEDARNLEETYFDRQQQDLVKRTGTVARNLSLADRSGFDDEKLKAGVMWVMAEHSLSVVRVVDRGQQINLAAGDASLSIEIEEALASLQTALASGQDSDSGRVTGQNSTYVVAGIRLSESRALIVAAESPPELTERLTSIDQQHRIFHNFLINLKRIKAIYILLLGAVALLLIFAATWSALHVAHGVTIPIQALAEATERVAAGDFAHPVAAPADDELAVLVRSFNLMSGQLAENRERLERAAQALQQSNMALENRSHYIETVLESLSTGVISTDEKAKIATINRAALYMLGMKVKPPAGTPINELTGAPQDHEFAALCRRARRTNTAQAEVELKRPDGSLLNTATTAVALRNSDGNLEGWVIVIEDLTDLIQAERAAAWSEVARRMAHEIKNPLTPIQLSAERILRHHNKRPESESDLKLQTVVRDGTAVIIREVGALQRMVEEFSHFARLPEKKPVEGALNKVVQDAIGLYADRLNGIRIECKLATDLPLIKFDPEQMKRVMLNLIDNAIEALTTGDNHSASDKLIRIGSAYLKEDDLARIVVADTGHGIKPADRDKLFLPKFSTRERGTGLGLAIVSHIIADHKGRIWVEDNQPQGAQFIIELPVS